MVIMASSFRQYKAVVGLRILRWSLVFATFSCAQFHDDYQKIISGSIVGPSRGVRFAQAASEVLETAGTAQIRVELTEPNPWVTTVTVDVAGGTALPFEYSFGTTTITFEPGETTKLLDIQLNDYSSYFAGALWDRTLILSLNSASGANIVQPNMHTLAIVNVDTRDLYLSGTGGSHFNGTPITSCGGGSACNAANPFVLDTAYAFLSPENYAFTKVTLVNGAVMAGIAWLPPNPVSTNNGNLGFAVTNQLYVCSSCRITMTARGYTAKNGPGSSTTSCAGGGFGGEGGRDTSGPKTSSYGYAFSSSLNSAGSGGGGNSGGTGGGGIHIFARHLTLHGRIEADGANGASGACPGGGGGGGAGGAILIQTNTIAGGGGALSANGGNGGAAAGGGGGGGGRIIIQYDEDQYEGTLDALNANAYGGMRGSGASPQDGAAGTIYFENKKTGQRILKVNNIGRSTDSHTTLSSLGEAFFLQKLLLQERGTLRIGVGQELVLSESPSFSAGGQLVNLGTLRVPDLDLTGGGLHNAGTLEIASGNMTIGNGGFYSSWTTSTLNLNNIVVKSGGIMTHAPNPNMPSYSLNIAAQNLTLEPGGQINADSKGYPGGQNANGSGPGAGTISGMGCATLASGAGHGGKGGDDLPASGGNTYGLASEPLSLGSGGAGGAGGGMGGAGGGLIVLNISGTLHLSGIISANGGNASLGSGCGVNRSGGGAGGSINIRAATLAGAGGIVSAQGGNGAGAGGGGGGGRIAIRFHQDHYVGGYSALPKNASPGLGGAGAQPGTVFTGTP
ncbi:MAG: hypothetical protein NZL89_04915 [Leptospiraceae bacterium]|nr:hypothetical protein [Leptospiraceae bacterium]